MEAYVLYLALEAVMFIAVLYGVHRAFKIQLNRIEEQQKPVQPPAPQIIVNLKPLEDKIAELPNKVLQSVQGSINANKGAIGELIGYIQLRASYDRIIPLGNIVDFVCLDFPTEHSDGKIIFVDVKNGKHARLSKDQKILKKIINSKNIEFLELKVSIQDKLNEET